jgi:cyclophilin family peptidyl-prolyl cis-trans isomerase
MKLRRFGRGLTLAAAVALASGCRAFAQAPAKEEAPQPPVKAQVSDEESPSQASAEDGPQDLATLLGHYGELDKELRDVGEAYAAASTTAERTRLREQYASLAQRLEGLMPGLQKAALAAFQANPADKQATNVLIGIVANDYRKDRNDEALQLARQLIDAGCKEPVLYAFAGCAAYCVDDYDAAEKYLTIAKESGRLVDQGERFLLELPERKELWAKEKALRDKEAQADDLPRVKLTTDKGDIVLELFENEAPNTVANFISLVEKKHYDGTPFHRVLQNFMAQGGDPTGTGRGGPGYHIPCECYRDDYRHHFRGSLSMAHAGRDTGGSQFFITFRPTPNLDNRHTCFGRVIEGHDVLAKIQRRDPTGANPPEPDRIVKAEVLRKRNHAYKFEKSDE